MEKTRHPQMLQTWSKHLKDPEKKAEFEKTVRNSTLVLTRLKVLLNEIEDNIEKSERTVRAYDLPNWDYRQAHINGRMQTLQEVKDLISFIEG